MLTEVQQLGPHGAEALHLLWERVCSGDLDPDREIDIESDDGGIAFSWRPVGLIEAARNVTTPLDERSCREYGLSAGANYGDLAANIAEKFGRQIRTQPEDSKIRVDLRSVLDCQMAEYREDAAEFEEFEGAKQYVLHAFGQVITRLQHLSEQIEEAQSFEELNLGWWEPLFEQIEGESTGAEPSA
jgi:hypothetical protein